MQAAPTASIHHCDVRIARASPTMPASAKNDRATTSTVRALTFRDAVSRVGPTRTSSVPRTPSE
jgi:hypothetical protein